MELRQYVSVLLKWWWLIAISVVVASLASFLATRATPPTYLASTTLMVGPGLRNPNLSQTDFSTGQALAQSYADMARREPVLKAALNTLGLQWDWTNLREMVSSRVIPGTQLMELSVIDTEPVRAKALAQEIAHQLILQSPAASDPQKEAERQFVLNQIDDLKSNIQKAQDEMRQIDDTIARATSARQIQDARSRQLALQTQLSSWQGTYAQLLSNLQQDSPNNLSVVEPAQAPTQPVGPRVLYNVLLAAVVGLVLAGGASFLLEYIDDSLKTAEDVQRAVGLETLGGIARIEGRDYPSKLVVVRHPRSPVAEAYRVLRTNLQFNSPEHPIHALMVTSSSPLEGKSVTAANLATTLAQSGRRVILVDGDLRRPTQHSILGLNNDRGLVSVLRGEARLADALQAGPVENLRVLTSGPLPDQPAELLGSVRMEAMLADLRQEADVVIVDSPPVLAVADATILAQALDATLLVVGAGTARRGLVARSKAALEAVGAFVPGVALNRLSRREGGYYYHYYAQDSRGDSGSSSDGRGSGDQPRLPERPSRKLEPKPQVAQSTVTGLAEYSQGRPRQSLLERFLGMITRS